MKTSGLLLPMLLISGLAAAQEAPKPAEPAVATKANSDATALGDAYDKGFASLLAGRYAEAAAELDRVATESTDTERRSAARELARLARLLQEKSPPTEQASRTAELIVAQENDGRAEFIVTSTLAGFYSSFVLLDVFGISDVRGSAVLVTGVTAGAFAGSLFGTRDRKISGGMASAYTGGLINGLANGLLLAPVLGIPSSPDSSAEDGEVNQDYLLFGLGTMALGGGLGAYFGYKLNPTRAQASVIGMGGITGFLSTSLVLLAVTDGDDTFDSNSDLALLALGLDAGVAAAIVVSPKIDWSVSRYRLVLLSEFLGALGGVAVAVIAVGEPDDDGDARVLGVSTLTGMWAGIGLGTYLTRNMSPDARFLIQDKVSWQLTPLILPHNGRGLGISGAF